MMKKLHYFILLRRFSYIQEPCLRVVRCLVNKGDCTIDVGANIGVYTKYLSKWVGNSGRVYSIEPIPSTFSILVSNTRRLHLGNVRPINCAISETDGTVSMEIPLDERGLESHYLARIVKARTPDSSAQLSVQTKSIDSLLSGEDQRITFIKIDTEGHELSCIKGALSTIKKYRPSLLIEISSDFNMPGGDGAQIANLLKEIGYSPWHFDGTTIRSHREGEASVNYFFLLPEHVKALENETF